MKCRNFVDRIFEWLQYLCDILRLSLRLTNSARSNPVLLVNLLALLCSWR